MDLLLRCANAEQQQGSSAVKMMKMRIAKTAMAKISLRTAPKMMKVHQKTNSTVTIVMENVLMVIMTLKVSSLLT